MKRKKATIKAVNETWYEIGEVTRKRHEDLFTDGDYARIAELANTTRATVGNRIKAGNGPESLVKAIQKFYREKEKKQAELNAA